MAATCKTDMGWKMIFSADICTEWDSKISLALNRAEQFTQI